MFHLAVGCNTSAAIDGEIRFYENPDIEAECNVNEEEDEIPFNDYGMHIIIIVNVFISIFE